MVPYDFNWKWLAWIQKKKLKPTIQQLVGPRMKLPLSSHTHLHQPPATEGASLERKGNEWRV